MDPMTMAALIGAGSALLGKQKTTIQNAAPAAGMSTPGGPLNVGVGPAQAPPGTIGIGELLVSLGNTPLQIPGTVGFDPNQKPMDAAGTVGMSEPQGAKLPKAQQGQINDLLKTAAVALQNPTIQKLLMGGEETKSYTAAPLGGGGVNPQVMPGMGLQRGNIGSFLANLPRIG